MTKNLADSVRAYTDSNEGEKTKQKKMLNFVSQKNTAFDKNHPDGFGANQKGGCY